MTDHREPIPSAPVHLLGEGLLPACGGGEGEGGCRMTPVSADVTCGPCRLVELRDPAGPTFVSPSGDRRERSVPCQRCRRSRTYALRGVCVPCLEVELERPDRPDRPAAPWLHDLHGDLTYRWLVRNRVMRNDEHGIELTYRGRRSDDVICGERTTRPGIEGFRRAYSFRVDQSVPHEVVCTIVGEHGELPHVGVPAECADMTCRCGAYGCEHLVIVRFAVRPELEAATR